MQNGTFQDVIEQVAATGVDISTLQTLLEQIMAWTPVTSLLWMIERIFVMHAIFDVPRDLEN